MSDNSDLITRAKEYIQGFLNLPHIDERHIHKISSMEILLEKFKEREFLETDFYLLIGSYVFYPPESLDVTLDSNGFITSINDEIDEPAYISDISGSLWSLLFIAEEVYSSQSLLAIPTSVYKDEVSRYPLLVKNILLTYRNNFIPELTLQGVESCDFLRNGERRFVVPKKYH